MAWGVLEPLHRAGIYTHHMRPGGRLHRPLDLTFTPGPTTITAHVLLLEPERHLSKALGMGPAAQLYLARVLSISDDAEWFHVRVRRGTSAVLFEIARPDPWHPTVAEIQEVAQDDIAFAVDSMARAVYLSLVATAPGVALIGKSGSGKSTAIRIIAALAFARGWRLEALIDLKNDEDYSDLEHLTPPSRRAYTNAEAARVLAELREEVDARMRREREKKPGLVVLDELPQLDTTLQQELAKIASLCRSAGIRVLLGGQRLGKEVDPLLKSQLHVRLVGQVASAQDSADAAGIPSAGAELLSGPGDMLYVVDGNIRRVAIANARQQDLDALLAQATLWQPTTATTTAPQSRQETGQPLTLDQRRAAYVQRVVAAWEVEAASHPQKVAPPRWLLLRALSHIEREGEPPSYNLLRTMHQQQEGASLSKARCDQVREAAQEWLLRV